MTINEGKDEKRSSSFTLYATLIRTLVEKDVVVIIDYSSSNIIHLQAVLSQINLTSWFVIVPFH